MSLQIYLQAVKRMGERNKLTEDQAKQRLESQLSNQERVQRSNVILSSLWEPEYTQSQVSVVYSYVRDFPTFLTWGPKPLNLENITQKSSKLGKMG